MGQAKASDGKEYAIAYGVIRHADREGRKSWYVSVRRQGIQVRRSFHDGMWGGEQMALAVACAYRKEVVSSLPPMTTHTICTRLKKSNTSGISGVSRQVNRAGRAFWIGALSSPPQRSRSFAVDVYGENTLHDSGR